MSRSNQLDHLLAEVATLQQTEKGLWRRRQTLRDALAVFQLAARDHGAELVQRLRPEFRVLADDETFERQAVRQQQLRLLQRDRLPAGCPDHTPPRDFGQTAPR